MKVISFNSYKGGACRTTTCYNTLPYLAKALNATSDEPILVFDTDLDSMGLTNIFDEGSLFEETMEYSARHLFVEGDLNKSLDESLACDEKEKYYKYFKKVGNALRLEDNGSVLFLGADKQAAAITDDDIRRFEDDPPLRKLIKRLRKLSVSPKALVFDCAAGVQMTTINILRYTHRSVICMRPTYQFRTGTAYYIFQQIPNQLSMNTLISNRELVLVPTAISSMHVSEDEPNRDKVLDALNNCRTKAFDDINQLIVNMYGNLANTLNFTLNTDMYEGGEVQGLPEIERFKWQEELLYKLPEGLSEEEKILEAQYEKLANILAR